MSTQNNSLVITLLVIISILLAAIGGTMIYTTFIHTAPALSPTSLSTTNSKPSTPTQVDEKVRWNTFISSKHFSLKYPQEYVIGALGGFNGPSDPTQASAISVTYKDPLDRSKPNLRVSTFSNSQYKSLIEIAQWDYQNNNTPTAKNITKLKQISFLGNNAYEYSFDGKGFCNGTDCFLGEEGNIRVIITQHNDLYVIIGFYNNQLFSQILSTFKFTDGK